MTVIQKVLDFGAAVINVIIVLIQAVFTAIAFAFSLVYYLPMLFLLIGLTAIMYGVVRYGDTAIENVEFAFRCRVDPFWEANVRPLVDGIIRTMFNPLICWWNAFVYFPYGVTREVIFPLLRTCGFFDVLIALKDFLDALFHDLLIDYIANRQFLIGDLDFTNICSRWQDLWTKWQNLFCCGCNDLCALFTKLPAIPMIFTSDQLKDDETWCFVSNTFNGGMKFIQEVLEVIKEFVYHLIGGPLPRPVFRDAFDRWCAASTCFWRSWENAMQNLWNNFIPFEFVWKDVFCIFDVMTCILLRSINLILKLLVNYDAVLAHFTNQDSTFWIQVVKEDFKEILNLWGPSNYFDPITQLLPDMTTMEITHYRLLNTEEAKPNTMPNPIFGKPTVTNCSCIVMTRIFCDPLNQGVTCAERYNGTLLATYDFCCFPAELIQFFVDWGAWMFEFTLHFQSPANFIVFLDRQPFTKFMKASFAETFKCLFGVFLVIEKYGQCVQTILYELILFASCMAELFFRITVAAVTLPYFETQLPGICNFLTCPGQVALNMAIGFLDRLVSAAPDSLINCLCFVLNNGFPVPPAGCMMGCVVGGFTPPPMAKLPGGHFRRQLNPIYKYSPQNETMSAWNVEHWWKTISLEHTGKAFKDVAPKMTERLDVFAENLTNGKKAKKDNLEKLVSSPPVPPIVCDPPPDCFDLCCLPKALLVIFAQSTAFLFRMVNAAFQTRNGMGSPYFSGEACASEACFQSDATAFIVNAIAPLRCLCNFINLVIPPTGFPDPCCFFTLLGEGLSCILQVVINIVTSLTSDPNYVYIKTPEGLLHDFDIILAIANATFECLCTFIRIIFGLILAQSDLVKNYDPCCIPQKIFRAIIEVIRMVGQILISLGTLEAESSQCYFYIQSTFRPNCVPTLTDLPILVQFDKIRAVLLAPPNPAVMGQCGAQVDPQFQNPDEEGIATCICRLLNAVMAQIFKPDPNSNDPPVCPIDLCCPIYNFSILIDEFLYFLARLIASFWQNWEARSSTILGNPVGPFQIPVEFIEFFFCDEYRGNTLGGPLGSGLDTPAGVINPNGLTTDKCGKIEPVLQALNNFMVGCLCSVGRGIGNIADNFLQWFFAFVTNETNMNPFPIRIFWPKCLCDGGPDGKGILRPLGDLIVVFLRQFIIFIRNLNNPSYWAPSGGSLTNGDYVVNDLSDNLGDINKTWIARFLTPFANAACTFVTNLACVLSIILGNACELQRYNVVSSVIAYLFQALIRIVAIIEAFMKIFAQELPGQCVGDPDQFVGTSGVGAGDTGDLMGADVCAPNGVTTAVLTSGILNADSLGSILVSLLTFIFDALIGIGRLGCSSICPTEDFVHDPDSATVSPSSTACVCYNKTPYTASPISICNFDVCKFYGFPDEVCPMGAQECNLATVCGVANPTAENCPRAAGDQFFGLFLFFDACGGGCKNMTEQVVTMTPVQNTWDSNPNTAAWPWFPTNHPTIIPKIPVCFSNFPGSLLGEAESQFGPGITSSRYQPLCQRSYCVQKGFCKNDQMVACSPMDPRGILDGIIISFIKYMKCILDTLFPGLGALLDALLIILSFLWQLSGGIIRFVVAIFIFLFKIVVRNPFVNFFSLVPDVLTLLAWFFGIFTQPVVLAAKDTYVDPITNVTSYVNPLQHLQQNKFEYMFLQLFGTNLDGCIDDPIPCFCAHFSNFSSKCESDIGSLTMAEVSSLMNEQFGGLAECDALIQHCADMQPTLWTDVAYSERFEYIKCVARQARGMHFANYSGNVWPKDFFNSEDGWYKLFGNFKERLVHHVTQTARAEQVFHQYARNASAFRQLYKNLDSRAKLYENYLMTDAKLPQDSPALVFLINMDSVWHKYNMGYYHYLSRRAWQNIRKGYLPLGSLKDNLNEITMSVNEILHVVGGVRTKSAQTYKFLMDGLDTVGKATGEAWHGNYTNFGNLWSEQVREESKDIPMPTLLRKIVDGSIFNLVPNVKTNVLKTAATTASHIWENIRNVEVRFKTLSWMSGPKWTPLKLYNFEAAHRLFYRAYYRLWPQYTHQHHYEKFILQGNCGLVDGVVDLGARLVDYCVANFEANLAINKTLYMSKSSPARHGSFFNTYNGRIRYETSATGFRRPKIIPQEPAKPSTPSLRNVDHRVIRRARLPPNSPPGDFDLFDWIACKIEDWFGVAIMGPVSDFQTSLQDWFTNPTTDPADYPNVGFRYWLTFMLRCRFPENLNCSIGIGLEDALIRVSVVFLIGFLISAFFFPSIISLIGLIGGLTAWFLIVFIVAFHYSPSCLIMWPSYTFQNGFSLPLPIFPLSAFATPECLWDEVVGLTDKYITGDYGFLINASLVNGPVAPPCDERIDFINCKDVGLGDGIRVSLYWLYRLFGQGFCDLIIGIASTTFGSIFPGVEPYLMETLGRFKNASPTEEIQQDFCGKLMAPSIAMVLLIAIPFVLVVTLILPVLISFIISIFLLFRTSPLFDFIANEGEQGEWTEIEAEDTDVIGWEDDEQPYVVVRQAQPPGFGERIARFMRDNIVPGYQKPKKLKKQ